MQICLQNVKKPTELLRCFLNNLGRRSLLGGLFLAFIALWITVEQSRAADPVDLYSGTAPAPIGVANGRLASEIVDAVVEETGGRTFVSVTSDFFVENANELESQVLTVSLPVALPGGLTFSPEALSEFVVQDAGQNRELEPLRSGSVTDGEVITNAYTLALQAPAAGSVLVSLSYRQDVGDEEKATFRFANSVGSRWPGPIDSARITLRFPQPTTREQILDMQPADMTFDGQQLTWYDSEFEPTEDVKITFVKPSVWQAIKESRLMVTQNPLSAESHYELASLYRSLLSTGPMTGSLLALQSLMIAELESVKQTVSRDNAPLRCDVHKELAAYYLDNIHHVDGSVDVSYLSHSVRELEQVLQICSESAIDSEQVSRIKDGYLYLARDARRRTYYEMAIDYLASADEFMESGVSRTSKWRSAVAEERRLCYLAWVRDLLQNGDFSAALEVAEKGGLGGDVLSELSLMPRFGSVQMSVLTDPTQRKIALSIAPNPIDSSTDVTHDAIAALAGVLESQSMLQVVASLEGDAYLLEIGMPYDSDMDLARQQTTLAQALPDWPELAFPRAILSSQIDEIVVEDFWFVTQALYRELVDTREADREFNVQLQACEAELAELEDIYRELGESDIEAQDLVLIRWQTVDFAQRGWQSLRESSRAVFSIDWSPATGEPIERTWAIRAGEVQEMQLGSQSYDLSAMAVAVSLGLFGIFIIVLVLLLFARLR